MKKYFRLVLMIAALAVVFDSCKKSDDTEPITTEQPQTPTTPTTPAQPTERDIAVADYKNNYLTTEISSTGWTGSTSSCSAGSISSATCDAVIKRINYFRRMVGLNDNCTMDASKYAQEQEAALMMTCNNQLSHYPPSTWTCYTTAGSNGAGSSNLALGVTGTAAVTAFMNDFGTGNEPVGHRRWILYSSSKSFSCGATNNAMALWVFGATGNTKIPEYIAYPAKGYMPQSLVFDRWSFGKPSADFSAATVTMTGPSGNVSVNVISKTANGYGDNTIVWVPAGIDRTNSSDVKYTVTVANVMVGGTAKSFTYDVTLIKP